MTISIRHVVLITQTWFETTNKPHSRLCSQTYYINFKLYGFLSQVNRKLWDTVNMQRHIITLDIKEVCQIYGNYTNKH